MALEILNSPPGILKLKTILGTEKFFKEYQILQSPASRLIIDENALKRISSLTSPQEVILEAGIPDYSFNQAEFLEGFQLFFDNISDPGNLGTIIRTADWFGYKTIYLGMGSVDAYNPKCVQASMTALNSLRIIYVESSRIPEAAALSEDFIMLATAMQGTAVYDFKFPEKGVLMFGNESQGLDPKLMASARGKLSIPASREHGTAESLNLGISVGIMLAERSRSLFIQNGN